MAVSISQLLKNINGIHKTLGERVVFYPDNAIEITNKVNKILSMYRKSSLLVLDESRLAEKELDKLTEILNDAKEINVEYEKFLKMIGLERIN
jgi:ABC-type uncharacterized transport system ATPase subunit